MSHPTRYAPLLYPSLYIYLIKTYLPLRYVITEVILNNIRCSLITDSQSTWLVFSEPTSTKITSVYCAHPKQAC